VNESASGAARVALANSLRGALRSLAAGSVNERLATAAALLSALAFALLEAAAIVSALRVARLAVRELPGLHPEFLAERFLRGGLVAATFLLVLGSLTTAVSTLFLSEELPARVALPIPHRRIVARQLAVTIAIATAPTLLLFVPALAVGAAFSPRPLVALLAAGSAALAVILAASLAGACLALVLVRAVPPRRARLLAATLSALGLAAALIGFRGARPERLFDPAEALGLLMALGETSPAPPGLDPIAWAARAAARGLFGDPGALVPGSLLLAAAVLAARAAPSLLADAHLRVWQESGRTATGPAPGWRSAARLPSSRGASLTPFLLRAEAATLLRDASTPAQIGSLAAVFVLDLLNLRFLPRTDPAARDLVAGLQTGLALFLVSALALRFAYPSVSGDGRAALVLRSLPLSPGRHLLARYLVRGLPAVLVALVLVGASGLVLHLRPGPLGTSLAVALAGALALPALHLGLGALFPRYAAPNAVAVALGPGGLFALTLSTALSLTAAVAVSDELRLLLAGILRVEAGRGAFLAAWCAAAAALGFLPVALAARSLGRADLPVS
jgi:ABC-2 type transport system permease protein